MAFDEFPGMVRADGAQALTITARGGKADTAKPFKRAESGVFEIALRHRGDVYRVIYDVQIGKALWVVHAFQKKSKSGIRTPQPEIDLIGARLQRLTEALK